jgi:hypothetical protein
VDLELSYKGGISPLFFLKFHGGLKGIWIDQIFRAKYFGGFSDGEHQMLYSNARTKNNCRGLGPRIGGGSEWILPHGWSLIGELAGAFALSRVDVRREDDSLGIASSTLNKISTCLKEAFWVWRPIVEAKTGTRWECCFGSGQKSILQVELAYEIQQLWEQNMFVRYTDAALFSLPFNQKGNLTLQGFSFTLSLGY